MHREIVCAKMWKDNFLTEIQGGFMASVKKTAGGRSGTQKKTTGSRSATQKKTVNNKKTSRTQAKSPTRQKNPLTREIAFLFVLMCGILAQMSVFHICGVFGELLSTILFGLMGIMAYIFPIGMIVATGFYISNPHNQKIHNKVWMSAGLFLCLCGLVQWIAGPETENIWQVYTVCSKEQCGGGFLGGLLAFELARYLGKGGALIVILALSVLFFMLLTGAALFSMFGSYCKEQERKKRAERAKRESYITYEEEDSLPDIYAREAEQRKEKKKRKRFPVPVIEPEMEAKKNEIPKKEEEKLSITDSSQEEQDLSEIQIFRSEEIWDEPSQESIPLPVEENIPTDDLFAENTDFAENNSLMNQTSKKKNPKTDKKEMEKEVSKVQEELSKATEKEVPYVFPSLDLLSRPKAGKGNLNNDQLRETALKLQNTLKSFGVQVKLGGISLGPSVTQYELIPEMGVKVSKITSLADDIKLALAASDIRIEAPIPGKAAVGIEVPNPERTMVTLRELLESKEFIGAKSKVTFAVGKDISGKTIVTDIAKMPHLLIAGATGSGKSVLINTLIMSIIYKADPNDVKMIMVDPKMVELTAYEDIPHLMIPVVKDPKKASAALAWAVAEMTNRYQKFADAGVRDIASYNAKIAGLTNQDDPEYQKMPQIVIIVDEFADLMMVAPGEVEDAVCRLAQLARAAGIHLVLATQRPSVNVITGLIKANIPSRIALSVSSAVDSRTIIDSGGAEKLLGNGDMLFAPQNLPNPIRVQGAFVSDEERDGVVSFLKNNSNGPSYNEAVTTHIESAPVPGAKGGVSNGTDCDELFTDAGYFIIEKDKASIGLLQRMFRIGFNRAARIMDQLADAGVVGQEEGTKARQILMTREQFENYLEENG